MTPKKNTSTQTISISPSLKEWIVRYVNVKKREHPDAERFSSVSAFYNYVLEEMMKCFKKGKTLDDLDRFLNQDVVSFYDNLSFKAIKVFYEMIVETNRYTAHDYEATVAFLQQVQKHFSEFFQDPDIYKIKNFLEKLRGFFLQNNIVRQFDIKIDEDPLKKEDTVLSMDAYCNDMNLCYENAKFMVALFSVLGFKLQNMISSKKSPFFRIKLIPTELFKRDDVPKEARIQLFKENFSHFTNLKNVINDKDYYLWMKMGNDENIFIDFDNEFALNKWIGIIESDVRKFSKGENSFLLKMLTFFEKIHWISILNKEDLVFTFRFRNNVCESNKKIVLHYFSKYSKIKELDNAFQLIDTHSP
ncbi:MAG: hypothetical protein BAJALOKI1v1_2050001 [Promethearchaeota archaeon]|nr:MAG: hypothetical protein BAJALOKI1v1_2050001 [Candidatus Lokiarchaeota archaeon]